MERKKWVDLGDFMNALDFARTGYQVKQSFARFPPSLKVFLCHAEEDKLLVQHIYNQLVFIGMQPWLDKEQLQPGHDWKLEIRQAIHTNDVFIACLSNTSISKSGVIQYEIEQAVNVAKDKPEGSLFIIPARLEECEIPSKLNQWQCVDLFSDADFDKLLASLHRYVSNR